MEKDVTKKCTLILFIKMCVLLIKYHNNIFLKKIKVHHLKDYYQVIS